MPATNVKVDIEGTEQLAEMMGRYPQEVGRYMAQASKEVGDEVIDSPGLSQYPPATSANSPPTPYYIRGRGMQTSPSRNNLKSERYGTQFYSKAEGYNTVVANRASYAKYLADEQYQARAMGRIGWKKLVDVAKTKVGEVAKIYEGWIGKLIRDLGLNK